MKELVVISGKGGTGKTSIVASLASLARRVVLADCDVDAADLHLVLQPEIGHRQDFVGGSKAQIDPARCRACGQCAKWCRFDAVSADGPENGSHLTTCRIDPLACEGCGVCVDYCPWRAIELQPVVCGQWFVSRTRFGPLVHAQLAIASENSGKLVTHLRRTARRLAEERHLEIILCDGPPGIGCPVIASLTGADLALFVAEPTISGLHDLRRLAELAKRLQVPGMLAVNKADVNPDLTVELEQWARQQGLLIAGRVPYDAAVTRAQVAGQPVVEVSDGPAASAIRALWTEVATRLPTVTPTAMRGLIHLAG